MLLENNWLSQKQIGTTGTGTLCYSIIHLKGNKSMRYNISESSTQSTPNLGKGTKDSKCSL